MAARRKANILGSRNMNSSKPLPTILSRKRKNDDEDVVQTVSWILDWPQRCLYLFVQDINSYLNTNNKSDHSENLQGISFANIQLSRPNSRWDSDSECWFRCWHFVLVVFRWPPSAPVLRTSYVTWRPPAPAQTSATPSSCRTTPTPPWLPSLATSPPTVRKTGGSKPCPGRSPEWGTPGASK